jgi:hypothetical protein
MFVRENLALLKKHYAEVSKNFTDALPFELSGLQNF